LGCQYPESPVAFSADCNILGTVGNAVSRKSTLSERARSKLKLVVLVQNKTGADMDIALPFGSTGLIPASFPSAGTVGQDYFCRSNPMRADCVIS